ncbi:hypothetical protein GCM10027296_19310 [Chitinimonas naiadis]
MFPTGAPGIALILLRLSAATALLAHAGGQSTAMMPPCLLLGLSLLAVFLCLGLLTPIVILPCALLELVSLLRGHAQARPLDILLLLNAVALALLGPGAYSVDARFFGRRLIVLPPSQAGKP